MENLLRETLGERDVPRLAPGFERRVLAQALADQTQRLTVRGRRWLLAYGVAAVCASVLIVARIDWPALSPFAVPVLAPLSFGLTLGAPELLRKLKGG
jgi:hypothetical protein